MDALRAGIGGHAGLPLGDTQQMFEEYWQRGKYNDSAPTSNTAADVTSAQSSVGGKAGSVAGTKLEQHHGPSGNASSGNEESGGSDDVPTTLSKAQARRAQVRRAQIQHRQRKADYTKHLEMETAKFRDMIDKTTRESYALEAENETMRQMLVAKLGYLPAEALADAGAEKTKTTAEAITSADDDNAMSWEADGAAVMASERSNSSSSVATPLYSVSIGLSEVMGTPAMQIRRTSSPHRLSSESRTASVSQTPRTASISQTARSDSVPQAPVVPPVSQTPPSRNTSITSQGGGHFEMKPAAFEPADIITSLSEEQTDHAINFILGLEHICWDHWDRSYFTHQEYDETGCMHGHALMASTIALQAAPVEVFNKLDAVGEYLRTNPLHQQDRFEHGHCDHDVAEHVQYDKNMTRPLQGDESRASASSTSSASLMTFPDSGTRSQSLGSNMTLTKGSAKQSPVVQSQVAPAPGIPMLQESNISWPATGLSLETLHALASKLSPPETELAPVQAWFEILRAYGTVVVLNQELMAQMLAQFAGVVKCLHFGAVIERDAFDSVVTRVLGRAQWA